LAKKAVETNILPPSETRTTLEKAIEEACGAAEDEMDDILNSA